MLILTNINGCWKYNPERTLEPAKIIAIFLWFAAHEACSYRDVADRFHISLSTVHWSIMRAIVFLSNMAPQVIRWPSNAEMLDEAQVRDARQIPGVFGKYYFIILPRNGSGELYNSLLF